MTHPLAIQLWLWWHSLG